MQAHQTKQERKRGKEGKGEINQYEEKKLSKETVGKVDVMNESLERFVLCASNIVQSNEQKKRKEIQVIFCLSSDQILC